MIRRIISNGQPGVSRAALDVAMVMEREHGGWVPEGRSAGGDGILPERYTMRTMTAGDLSACNEQNILDSDGTLLLSYGDTKGEFSHLLEFAKKCHKPSLHGDLSTRNAFQTAKEISVWIARYRIGILHVAGPDDDKDRSAYKDAEKLLKAVLHFDTMDMALAPENQEPPPPDPPRSVKEAVDRLASQLPLKDRVRIANMQWQELLMLQPTLGRYIRDSFGLWSGNEALMNSCRFAAKTLNLREEEASATIIRRLWIRLKEIHTLKVVK